MNNKKPNLVENKINNYDRQIYSNKLVSVSDYISTKLDDIHSQIYELALNKYIEANDINRDNFRFTELKSQNFETPSIVLMTDKRKPYTKQKIDLSAYWEPYQYATIRDYTYIMTDKNDNPYNAEMYYIDYLKGMAKIRNKISGNEYCVPFSMVDENTPVSMEELSLIDTFTYIWKDR